MHHVHVKTRILFCCSMVLCAYYAENRHALDLAVVNPWLDKLQ